MLPEAHSVLTPEQQRKRTTVDALVSLIETKWSSAVSARQGVSAEMVKSQRALKGEPISGIHLIPELPITYNITASIHRGIVALISDAFAASAENLFVVSTTTVPTLSEEDTMEVARGVQETLAMQEHMSGEPASDEDGMQLEEEFTKALLADVKEKAVEAAQALGDEIKDSFEENGWGIAVSQAIYDFIAFPAMVIKAPASVYKKKKVWDNGALRVTHDVVNGVERIAPYNFYPAPNAQDVQSADFVFEVRTVSANELAILATDISYDGAEILRVFAEHPLGLSLSAGTDPASVITKQTLFSHDVGVGFYEVKCFYGKAMGAHLSELGIEGTDPTRQYEAEIFVIGSCVIRAVLTGESGRPFHTLAYDPIPGSLWGHSPVTRLFDVQRAINSAYAAMIRDLQLAGVHIELTTGRLHDEDNISDKSLAPGVVRVVNSDPSGAGRRAYDIFPVTPSSDSFRQTINDLEDKAYKLVGFTRMTLGETQGSGTIGRTAGGVAAMLNQANKGLRQILRSIETNVIEPVVQSFIDTRLMTDPPEGIRGDVNVRARGLTGLLEREGQVDSLQWQLQTLAAFAEKVDPVTGQPIIPSSVPLALVKQMFVAKGLKTDGIFPDARGGAGGLPAQPTPQDPTAAPELDGRSPDAAAAIAQSNNPMGA